MKKYHVYSQNGFYSAIVQEKIKPVKYKVPGIIRFLDFSMYAVLIMLLSYILLHISGIGISEWVSWIMQLVMKGL